MVAIWLSYLGYAIATFVVVWSCLKTFQANPERHKLSVWLQLISYYAHYWMLWLLIWANYHLVIDQNSFYVIVALFALLYLYSSWIEPNRLQVHHQTINLSSSMADKADISTADTVVTIAVISDLHVGLFSTKKQLERLVSKLNALNVDAILMAGDWLYYPGADLIGQMMVLKGLNKPCYTTLSQADLEQIRQTAQIYEYNASNESLDNVLATLGIEVLQDETIDINGLHVMGISEGNNVTAVLNDNAQTPLPDLILVHDLKQLIASPQRLATIKQPTLVIAGQTHGGQANVPILTNQLVKAITGIHVPTGLSHSQFQALDTIANGQARNYQAWISSGIGMTGLPFRFNCPPRIDVLTIQRPPVLP